MEWKFYRVVKLSVFIIILLKRNSALGMRRGRCNQNVLGIHRALEKKINSDSAIHKEILAP